MAILIVVMSVMDGFEIEVKKRLLAFSPHISLRYAPTGEYEPIEDWYALSEQLKQVEGVSEVAGTIDDNAIIEHSGNQLPVAYRGINTQDPEVVKSISELLTHEYGQGTADLGLESEAVILESRARQLGIQVGDVIQLYSTRNFDEVFDAYKRTERPRASEEFKDDLTDIITTLKEKKVSGKPAETFHIDDLQGIYERLLTIQDSGIRPGEGATIDTVLDLIYDAKKLDETSRQLPKGTTEHIEQLLLVHLAKLDNSADDNEELKKLKSIILPRDVKVVGIYRISQQVVAPDFFLPLPLAQELSGLDSGIHALSIRLNDVDEADVIARKIVQDLDAGWYPSTWIEQYSDFFKLVQMQELMLGLVLSVVSLGAAFLITIVMFLTALQKKKEIGVLLAVGARPTQICMVFFIQGIVIGVIGVILGIISGFVILHNRASIQYFFAKVTKLDFYSEEFAGTDTLPASTSPQLVICVSLVALIMCAIAPILPAIFAARNDPAKSLRDL